MDLEALFELVETNDEAEAYREAFGRIFGSSAPIAWAMLSCRSRGQEGPEWSRVDSALRNLLKYQADAVVRLAKREQVHRRRGTIEEILAHTAEGDHILFLGLCRQDLDEALVAFDRAGLGRNALLVHSFLWGDIGRIRSALERGITEVGDLEASGQLLLEPIDEAIKAIVANPASLDHAVEQRCIDLEQRARDGGFSEVWLSGEFSQALATQGSDLARHSESAWHRSRLSHPFVTMCPYVTYGRWEANFEALLKEGSYPHNLLALPAC